jgi:hypothetical protein
MPLEGLLEVTYINQGYSMLLYKPLSSATLGSDRKALVAVGLLWKKEGQNLLIMMLALARLMTL